MNSSNVNSADLQSDELAPDSTASLLPSRLARAANAIPFGVGPRVVTFFSGDGLKAKAMRGSAWTIAGYGAGQVLRLGSNLILTRLLFPEAFGLMALVQVFMQGLAMFSDVGIGPSIIQNKRGDDPAFYNTAWTIQVIRGLLLTLGAAALAWPVSQFYDEPMLLQLLPVAGLSALIAGFNSTKIFTANRHLALGRLTAIELISQIVAIVCLIALAWWLRSVWALVFGGLVGASAKVVLSQTGLPGPTNRLRWDRTAVAQLFRFGKWIFVSTVFTFLAMQSDRLLLGRLVGMEVLGIYSIAMMLVMICWSVIGRLNSKVLMPGLADKIRSGGIESCASVIRRTRWALDGLAGGIILALVLLCPLFVTTLYDPRYHAAGWLAQLLCVGLWFSTLSGGSASILLATGDSRSVAYGNIANTVATLILAPLGYWHFEIEGFILGWSAGNLTGLVLLHGALIRRELRVWRIDLLATSAVGAASGVTLVGQYQLTAHTDLPTWLCQLLPALLATAVLSLSAVRHRQLLMRLMSG